jgi:tetratricopeptide (TPR) repeat protein
MRGTFLSAVEGPADACVTRETGATASSRSEGCITRGRRVASRVVLASFALTAVAARCAWSQSGASPQSAQEWYQHYESGLSLIAGARGAEARAELLQALALKAEEGLSVATAGSGSVDYLPHLFLAMACHVAGDDDAALHHLAAAERSGVAAQSQSGAPLLAAYRFLLGNRVRGSTQATAPPAPAPSFEAFVRRPPVLTPEEYARLRDSVLSRCGLSRAAAGDVEPWYFHYELGLELSRHGDHQRAIEALIESAHRKPASERNARTYGMWFLDYRPYLSIAREHAYLGNRECAIGALRLAERYHEDSMSRYARELAEVRELLSE